MLKILALCLISFYRRFISPLKKPCCRFTPPALNMPMRLLVNTAL